MKAFITGQSIFINSCRKFFEGSLRWILEKGKKKEHKRYVVYVEKMHQNMNKIIEDQ